MSAGSATNSYARDASSAPGDDHAKNGQIRFHVVGGVAVLTLDRPHALNALSHKMVRDLATFVEQCRDDDQIAALVLRGNGEKGFCAGGDVRALYHAAERGQADGPGGWRQFFIDEYRLDFALHTFAKPIVALADGIAMGGGMGLAQAATLRVATARSKIAMPETRIGFVPDVGATRFLSVMPEPLELYVGLTGVVLSGADALRCGLVDACVPHEWLATFEARLERLPSGSVAERLREVFVPPANVVPHAPLDAWLPAIDKHFDPRLGVPEIVASLERALCAEAQHPMRDWLEATRNALQAHSPTMLHVTREALLRGRTMTLGEAFRMELDIASHAIDEGDFREGVRAHLIDRDGRPSWCPATLDEIGAERVHRFLSSPWKSEAHPLAGLGEEASTLPA